MNICIIGAGYVGLTTVACLSLKHKVMCIDTDNVKIKKLQKNIIPIYEPKLQKLLSKNKKRIIFNSSYDKIKQSDIFFIAVGTPSLKSGKTNTSYLFNTIKLLSKKLPKNSIVVIKSTIPPTVFKQLNTLTNNKLNIVANPEFLREGSAITDFLNTDRIIIGSKSTTAINKLKKVYKKIIQRPNFFVTSAESASMIKYASNTFLASRISFVNELSIICDQVGANIKDVAKGVGQDKRIGSHFLIAGPGFGGSCFPKDINSLSHFSSATGYPSTFSKNILKMNTKHKNTIVKKIIDFVATEKSKTITILGMTFKSNTDDTRDSQGLYIANKVASKGLRVQIYDPVAVITNKQLSNGVVWCSNLNKACKNSKLIVICTEWPEFKKIKFNKNKIIYDLRNLLNKQKMKQKNIVYFSLGTKYD